MSNNQMDKQEKINAEKTIILSELADLLKPKQEEVGALVIKTKDFKYPLKMSSLNNEKSTSVQIKQGDILFSDSFSGQQKFYLVDKEPSKKVFASTFLVVIRPKNIQSEYLFLYLQSDTAKKYFLQNKSGGFFPRIPLKSLAVLPIIIPELETQSHSKSIFEKLFLPEKPDILHEINKELFAKPKINKPIQKEFLEEEIEKLKVWKKEILTKVIQEDFQELQKCKEYKLYKSFLILSGSALEAFLLDWISELEKKDYFSTSTENLTLGKLIFERLKKLHSDVFSEEFITKANRIMQKRNLVHPKVYFNAREKVNDQVCNEIIDDLKFIFNQRI